MDEKIKKAEKLLKVFKKDSYIFGTDCLGRAGELAERIFTGKTGRTALLVISDKKWASGLKLRIRKSLEDSGIRILKETDTSGPNAPREDVYFLQDEIVKCDPDMVVVAGGGSAIDCVKAATVLASVSPGVHDIEPFFGAGQVSKALKAGNKKLKPVFAIQMASSSAAHLTKYSNITDMKTSQKKLIVDDAITPPVALFDYSVTLTMPRDLTIDGATDGISHALEVYMGAGRENIDKIEEVTLLAISLAVNNLPGLIKDLQDLKGREALGFSTDLGGYSIMLGGTSGAHLTSFSLVDILSHGRACAILNPYYLVFFAPAIERQLKQLASVFKDYIGINIGGTSAIGTNIAGKPVNTKSIGDNLSATELGKIVAGGIINFYRTIGLPSTLGQIASFTDGHIEKAIEAAKNPQLEMKLKNMPVPLDSTLVEKYMRPILEAAKTGDLSLISKYKIEP
jgi:alcohol dehydrogenase